MLKLGTVGVALLMAVAACEAREGGAGAEGEAAAGERSGTDTMVRSTTVQDTTIVRADTSIEVDTVKTTNNAGDSARPN